MLNNSIRLQNKRPDLPPPPTAQNQARPGGYFQYLVKESNQSPPAQAPYHMLARRKNHFPTQAASVLPDGSTHIASQALSCDREYSRIFDDDPASLIDDLDPVPEFIHHPRVDIWLRPRRTLRFVASHAPGSARFALMVVGLALSSKLMGLEFVFGLSLLTHAFSMPWYFSLALILGTGMLFGKLFWKWESLINTSFGRMLGGYGGRDLVQQAILWSYLPTLANLGLHGAALLFLGPKYLAQDALNPQWFSIIAAGISLYAFIFGVFLLSEAHRISLIRGLTLRIIASATVYGLPLAAIALVIKLVST